MAPYALRFTLQLGVTQTIGYASTYYLAAILARPITADLDIPFEQYFVFSAAASIISGLLGPILGRQIDRFGGRLVLPFASLTIASGLVVMALSTSATTFFVAWLILGIGMAAGLYDAAFASVVEIQGERAQRTIAGVTLIAGFASTVGWPLTSALEQELGWRETVLVWAAINLAVALPLHVWLPGYGKGARRQRRTDRAAQSDRRQAQRPPAFLFSRSCSTAMLFVLAGFAPKRYRCAPAQKSYETTGATGEIASGGRHSARPRPGFCPTDSKSSSRPSLVRSEWRCSPSSCTRWLWQSFSLQARRRFFSLLSSTEWGQVFSLLPREYCLSIYSARRTTANARDT